MSTRSSIFYTVDPAEKFSCHIYWELAEREIRDGKMVAAPLYMGLEAKGRAER